MSAKPQGSLRGASEPPRSADLARALRKRPFRHPGENLIMVALILCATVSIATTFAIVYILFADAIGFFREVSFWHFLNPTNEWQTLFEPRRFGVWELVFGTINVTLWSMVIALPLGLAAAIYLSEYAHVQTRRFLKPLLELLAGVPTVVYAYFALTFISDDVLLPLLGDNVSFFNSLAASIMLAVMILPTIASVSEDAMASVPATCGRPPTASAPPASRSPSASSSRPPSPASWPPSCSPSPASSARP